MLRPLRDNGSVVDLTQGAAGTACSTLRVPPCPLLANSVALIEGNAVTATAPIRTRVQRLATALSVRPGRDITTLSVAPVTARRAMAAPSLGRKMSIVSRLRGSQTDASA